MTKEEQKKEYKMTKKELGNKNKIIIYGWKETLDDTINCIKFLNTFKFTKINTYDDTDTFQITCIRQKDK